MRYVVALAFAVTSFAAPSAQGQAAAPPQSPAAVAAKTAPAMTAKSAPASAAKSAAAAKKAPATVSARPTTAAATAATAKRVPAGQLLDAIRKRGTLVVATAWNVPWVMRDPQGEWQGFEIDVARQLAADLGVELKIVRVPFAEFTNALTDGTADVVVAGYSITPQRALVVDFSNPYGHSTMQLIVRKDLAAQDVNRADIKIGARTGATPEATAHARFPQAQTVPFSDERSLYAALKDGKIDGALAYIPRTTMVVAQAEGALAVATSVSSLPSTVEGFAVRKGEPGFINFLNAWIAYWQADGWLDERRSYWFESFAWTPRFSGAAAAK